MDNHTPEQRRRNMQAIRSEETGIEVILRRELWKRGLRYRKNCRDLPGKPDIVFKRKKVAVFCDSEFWHGYDWENRKDKIGTNRDYWIPKIEKNMENDRRFTAELESMGYAVIRFWGKEIMKHTVECADIIESAINSRYW